MLPNSGKKPFGGLAKLSSSRAIAVSKRDGRYGADAAAFSDCLAAISAVRVSWALALPDRITLLRTPSSDAMRARDSGCSV